MKSKTIKKYQSKKIEKIEKNNYCASRVLVIYKEPRR